MVVAVVAINYDCSEEITVTDAGTTVDVVHLATTLPVVWC